MKSNYLFILLASFCLAFTSCGDDDEPTPDTRSLLVNKNWKISGISATNGTATQDIYEGIESCNQDDVWTFADNGYYQMNEGATKCEPTYAQIYETGTWTLADDELTMTVSGDESIYTIEEISASTLKLSATGQSQGQTITLTIDFVSQ